MTCTFDIFKKAFSPICLHILQIFQSPTCLSTKISVKITMVCCVPGCLPADTSGGLVRVVKFPTEDDLRRRWLQAVEIGSGTALDDDDADYQLCTGHFEWAGDEQEYREPTVFGGG